MLKKVIESVKYVKEGDPISDDESTQPVRFSEIHFKLEEVKEEENVVN